VKPVTNTGPITTGVIVTYSHFMLEKGTVTLAEIDTGQTRESISMSAVYYTKLISVVRYLS
jgi:hypothetical protein